MTQIETFVDLFMTVWVLTTIFLIIMYFKTRKNAEKQRKKIQEKIDIIENKIKELKK